MSVKLIVMCGPPGSGKSTYAKKLAERENACIISTDKIRKKLYGDESRNDEPGRVFAALFHNAKKSFGYKRSVIIDCTNPSVHERKKFLKKFEGFYDESICVFMDTPFKECVRRNENRERVVPYRAVKRIYYSTVIPTKEEGFDKIEIVKMEGEMKDDMG